jgi:AraC family transcriptional regulator
VNDLSLAELARVAGMDLFRFVRAFKTATGHTPHHYVLQARIDRAKEFLHDPKVSISDVALRTGFANPSHFAATFHRISGTTPRAWRSTVV